MERTQFFTFPLASPIQKAKYGVCFYSEFPSYT